jgi:hypothetical protein
MKGHTRMDGPKEERRVDRSSAEIETNSAATNIEATQIAETQIAETQIAETEMAHTHTVNTEMVETEMVDLSDISLDELRTNVVEPLEPYLRRVLSSIVKPRVNLGGAGPPGRDD